MTCSGVSSAGPLSLIYVLLAEHQTDSIQLPVFSTRGTCEHIKDMYLCISVALCYNARPPFTQLFWQTDKVGRPKVVPCMPRCIPDNTEYHLAVNIVATLLYLIIIFLLSQHLV